ncbi:MAG TPA: hypothetical protein VIT68_02140, partial [Candidatus Gracilibacteria bacterium]
LYLQYLKWTLFPESMRKQFDEYYKLVGKLDSALFQSNKAGVEELQKVTEIVDFHLSVVDNLFPYVIMPERVVTGSSSHDIEEFQSELEEGLKDSIAALQREFDWGRMRYCADKDIFKNIDPSIKPEDIQKDLLERPKIFNAYVNAGEGPEFIYGRNVKQEKDGDVRDKRRAPTIGTFNPQTFCSAQARQEDESREEKEIDNFFESVIGFYDKLLSFFQSDDEKAQAGSQDGYGERYELLANEKVKQTSRRRKRTHQSQLNCMTQYYKNLHQFDQFQLEMEEERFKNALVPIIKDSNTILNSMKVICKKHNVLLGCPLN